MPCMPRIILSLHAYSTTSAPELEALEALQLLLDALLVQAARALGHPGPLLQQQLLPRAIGLEVDHRDDLVPDQHRLAEVAQFALRLGYIGLEKVLVAEEELQAPALQDERVEGRQDVDAAVDRRKARFERFGTRPVLPLPGPLELDRHELLAPHARFDQPPHRRLARRVHVADRLDAHDAL